jgi:hypothetical protein
MRLSIIAATASLAILSLTPASQASPLIPAGGLATAAEQNDVVQVYWRHHRYWGWHHGYHHRWWRHHCGWRHHRCW